MPMSSPSAFFKAGRYSELVMHSDRWSNHWEVYAAQALIGLPEQAIEPLGRFDEPQARFFQAAACWIAGDTGAARALCRGLETSVGVGLAELSSRDRINVLCQLPANRHGPHVHLIGAAADPLFQISNISHHHDDLPLRPGASIWDYANRESPPDLFLCEMVEWHQIPTDFQELPCPLIGATSDFDLHIQGIQPWLNAFDLVLVNDHTEYAGLRGCTTQPMAVFPLLFGCPSNLPTMTSGPRDIDVFMSGTLFAPYHPDKASLLHAVLDLEDLNVVLVNGHMPEDDYFDFLSRSKLTVSYYRRPGGMVTRGIEAVCMGCVVLLQDGSVLNLYAPESHGIVPYDSTPDGLAHAIAEALPRMPDLQRRAAAAAPHFRAMFAGPSVASRFLRTMAVMGLLHQPVGRPVSRTLVQKRNMFWKGWQPGGGNLDFASDLAQSNLARLALLPSPLEERTNEEVREILLAAAASAIARKEPDWDTGQVAPALDRLLKAVTEVPNALVPAFNYIRGCLHFGTPKQKAEAIEHAIAMADRDEKFWRVTPLDDVYPYDFCSDHFNYRAYLDLVTSGIQPDGLSWREDGASDFAGKAVRFLLAGLHHYLALVLDSAEHANCAWNLDPDFPPYLLDFAARHAAIGGDLCPLVPALTKLVRNSAFAPQAMEQLRVAAAMIPGCCDLLDLEAHMDRYNQSLVENDSHLFKVQSAYFRQQILGPGGQVGPVKVMNCGDIIKDDSEDGDDENCSLSIISNDRMVLHGNVSGRVIYAVPSWAGPVGLRGGETLVKAPQTTPLLHPGRAMNVGLRAAESRWVALVGSSGTGLSADAFQHALQAVKGAGAPRVAMVMSEGDGRVAALVCRRIDALLCGGLEAHQARFCLPPDLERLASRLQENGVRLLGGIPMPSPPVREAATRLWPELFSTSRRRRPHLEDTGLVKLGLDLMCGSTEGSEMLETPGGVDLLYHLDRGLNSRRIDDGLRIERDCLADRVLVSPTINFLAGRYHVQALIRSDEVGTVCRLVLDRFGSLGKAEEQQTWALGEINSDAHFEIAVSGQFRLTLIHIGVASWDIVGLKLRREV